MNTNFLSRHTTFLLLAGLLMSSFTAMGQGTRLLRQPDISADHIAFVYASDIWIANRDGSNVRRITSTPAIESNPNFSPDGKTLAFSSNRSGSTSVYSVSVNGGEPSRHTWYPTGEVVKGWTNDGKNILFASSQGSAPTGYNRLWTVPFDGGPSSKIMEQWGMDGAYSPNGTHMVIDRVSRWDGEWRAYRGGQNTPLIVIKLEDLSETLIPNEHTTDISPVWMGDMIYFLSDRDLVSNVWSYSPQTQAVKQITSFKGSDIKWLAGHDGQLIIERDGFLHNLNPSTGQTNQLNINVVGDFPWAETKWEDVSSRARSVSLSPTGKRALVEARGEIFTIPIEHGNARNLTLSSGAADRAPIWSPKGKHIAWFSDKGGKGYALMIANQDGLEEARSISIGESKMAWEPAWSPNGKHIAFVDDDTRIRVVEVASGNVQTIDIAGTNLERGGMGIKWSSDSKWLAYAVSGSNNFRQIKLWSAADGQTRAITNPFADAFSPSWDRDGKHMYFLASTSYALSSGWANTSAITSRPNYAAYIINLRADDPSPFTPRSDEEEEVAEESMDDAPEANEGDDKKDKKKKGKKDKKDGEAEKPDKKAEEDLIKIDFDGIERRIMALPMPTRNYRFTMSGPAGSVFISEAVQNERGLNLHKFDLEKRKANDFLGGVRWVAISANGKKMLARTGPGWKVVDTGRPNGKDGKPLRVDLKVKLNRAEEWAQIFEEAWRYEADYFYDPNTHGRDWQAVHDRYAPLIPFVKHRADLTYILDQVNGELSVGHSFVFGGDYPRTDRNETGLLGADLVAENGRWKIARIFTTESWNPGLSSPLDRPELKTKEGDYLVGINGQELTASDDPYQLLDGTAGKQTLIHTNSSPTFEGSIREIVEPIRSENALRQRAWVEDNRRKVDELSGGKLAYVWVPNTSFPGFVSFNRYYFAQQDKLGAVIDERFNGGGLLDDYMVDLMTRRLRAAITNEVPNGKAIRLPAGILGPKALLINEMAGSGGDFFPWVFRQQQAGPLIGATTWGGLVKSSVHYGLVDGGALTAPDNAVFDPIKGSWIAENRGVAPDIAVRQDAQSLAKGEDPQLKRAVEEVLKLLEAEGTQQAVPPAYPSPATGN
ncbi:MAG: PDZ domain-containing protein [Bacteroidota bacterium]